MSWYVVRTKPHQERQAEFHLRQLSVETFLPVVRHSKTIRGQDKIVVEPLFPRYLFARFDLMHQYRAVSFARGVVNIVAFGPKPAEVSEPLIQAIKDRLKDGYAIPETESFQKGQIVQIKRGPLAGLEAVFIREMKGQHRVGLFLKTLGLHARLTMDIDQVSLPRAL